MTFKEQYEREREIFFSSVDNKRRIDDSFARPEDIPLTEEEIRAVDEYWGKYRFAYPKINYTIFQTYKNRFGQFDVRFIPGAVRTEYLSKHFINKSYAVVFQHKSMLPFLYPDIRQPQPVVVRMNSAYFDSHYDLISREEAVKQIHSFLQEDKKRRIIIKPNGSSGGHNISVFTCNDSIPQIGEVIKQLGISAFIAQEMIHQSEFTSQFNPSSVNTIRITSLLFEGKITPLAALIRIGKVGADVDNWCSGGALLGIDINTGKCNNWILSNDLFRSHIIPPSIDLSEKEMYVPNFDKVKNTIIKCHSRIPYIRMISWDIALDEENEPVLIECNFGGMIQLHQAVTGPLFGSLTDRILDKYLVESFSLKGADDNYIYNEFSDHAVINKFIGNGKPAAIPLSYNDKPVTSVQSDAFKGVLSTPVVDKLKVAFR